MAEITGSGGFGNDRYWMHTWAGLANGDTGRPVRESHMADKTVSLDGTFGAGGSVRMEGSMDGSTWFVMSDIAGDPAVLTGAGSIVLAENPRLVRPNVTAGDGTTSLNVRIGASARR